MYPAEYRDYRDHQFFLLSILVGMGTWEFRLESGMPAGEKRSWQSGDDGFYGIILKRCCRAADGGAGRIFDGTGGDGMQERDGTAFWEWG